MGQTTKMGVGRFFTSAKSMAYDQLQWTRREAVIEDSQADKSPFEQNDVEFPEAWSLNAVNLAVRRYFRVSNGTVERKNSLKHLVDRLVDTIVRQGTQEGYFDGEAEIETFREELKYIIAAQRATFDSRVWLTIGASGRSQQTSTCSILGIGATVPSILNWHVEAGMSLEGGCGTGSNLSSIPSSFEASSIGAGTVSGPMSFMRGADAATAMIKSENLAGPVTKMMILNIDHPDIEQFIWSKALEEHKARDLQAAGWDVSVDGKDSGSVPYRNINTSLRVSDDFMQAVADDNNWELKSVITDESVKTVKARDLFRQLTEATWESAAPGIQFDTMINRWHTTPNAGHINASSATGEYMHLDDSACNLASINLLKYLREDGTFDVEAFKHTIEVITIAQEVLVGYSKYSTDKIAKKTRAYRQLGLSPTNLGALLMAQGLAYDSEEGRAQAAAITALMTGHAYATSAKLACKIGPFAGFNKDRVSVLDVLHMHRAAVSKIDAAQVSEELLSAATGAWDEAVELSDRHGVRNSQVSLVASADDSMGLIMDCAADGIEPNLDLVRVANQTLRRALKTLGYTAAQTDDIINHIRQKKTIWHAPHLQKSHETVFACSVGDNAIHPLGRIKLMAAVQPFLSGAIGKAVTLPEEANVEDIEQIYTDAWEMGLKAIAICRDNCKVAPSPGLIKKESGKKDDTVEGLNGRVIVKGALRRELPKIRSAKTFSFTVGGSRGYVTIGEYHDGAPGEMFVNMAKADSTLVAFMDSFAHSVSYGLQYGVPLKLYVKALSDVSFAPAGVTDDPEIRTASSVIDYIFRRLALSYLTLDDRLELGLVLPDKISNKQTTLLEEDMDKAKPNSAADTD